MDNRYFYHCFPRPRRKSIAPVDGIEVLKSILANGLLLVPEIVEFGNTQIIQRRICFTELAEDQLPDHACEFGEFALEFEIDTLRELGGMPAIYLPSQAGETKGLNGVGGILPAMYAQLQDFIQEFKRLKHADAKWGKFLDDTTNRLGLQSVDHLYWVPEVFLNLCMPTENLRYTDGLGYYRQREWRLIHNFVHNGEMPARELSSEQKSELEKINPFFSELIGLRDQPRAERSALCLYFRGLNNELVFSKVRRLHVPQSKFEQVSALLKVCGFDVPVVTLPLSDVHDFVI
ncbi:MAG: hypothetical protein ABL974_02980 [Prosthecobacter sp.]